MGMIKCLDRSRELFRVEKNLEITWSNHKHSTATFTAKPWTKSQCLWNSMLLTISPRILGASFCLFSLSSSSGGWVPQGNSSGVVQVLLAPARGTVSAQVSSVPPQVKESESCSAPVVVQSSLSLLCFSIPEMLQESEIPEALSAPQLSASFPTEMLRRDALNLLFLSCWLHISYSQMVKLLPTAALHYGSLMSRLLVNFSFSPAKLSFCASSWGHPSKKMTPDKNPPFFPNCHTVLLWVVERVKPSENILPCF